MKPSALVLALLATVSLAAADSTPVPATPSAPPLPASAPVMSAEATKQLTETPPTLAAGTKTEATADATDPDVIELPKVTVTQRPRPRLGQSTILGPKAFNEDLAKKNLSSFDRDFLNKFSIPSWLGGVSAADRAREEYNYQQKVQLKDDVNTIARAAEMADPANAKALRDAAAKP